MAGTAWLQATSPVKPLMFSEPTQFATKLSATTRNGNIERFTPKAKVAVDLSLQQSHDITRTCIHPCPRKAHHTGTKLALEQEAKRKQR